MSTYDDPHEVVFLIYNLLIVPMWALIIFLPTWKGTHYLVHSKIVPVLYAILYMVYIIVSSFVNVSVGSCPNEETGGFLTLSGLIQGFHNKLGMTAAWMYVIIYHDINPIVIIYVLIYSLHFGNLSIQGHLKSHMFLWRFLWDLHWHMDLL